MFSNDMSERFKVTKSEEAVLYRNYGAVGTTDEDTSDGEQYGKNGEARVIIGNSSRDDSGKEDDDKDGTIKK